MVHHATGYGSIGSLRGFQSFRREFAQPRWPEAYISFGQNNSKHSGREICQVFWQWKESNSEKNLEQFNVFKLGWQGTNVKFPELFYLTINCIGPEPLGFQNKRFSAIISHFKDPMKWFYKNNAMTKDWREKALRNKYILNK